MKGGKHLENEWFHQKHRLIRNKHDEIAKNWLKKKSRSSTRSDGGKRKWWRFICQERKIISERAHFSQKFEEIELERCIFEFWSKVFICWAYVAMKTSLFIFLVKQSAAQEGQRTQSHSILFWRKYATIGWKAINWSLRGKTKRRGHRVLSPWRERGGRPAGRRPARYFGGRQSTAHPRPSGLSLAPKASAAGHKSITFSFTLFFIVFVRHPAQRGGSLFVGAAIRQWRAKENKTRKGADHYSLSHHLFLSTSRLSLCRAVAAVAPTSGWPQGDAMMRAMRWPNTELFILRRQMLVLRVAVIRFLRRPYFTRTWPSWIEFEAAL